MTDRVFNVLSRRAVTVEILRTGDREPVQETVPAADFHSEQGIGDHTVDNLNAYSEILVASRDGYVLTLSITVIGPLMPDDDDFAFSPELEVIRPSSIENAEITDSTLRYSI